jgi:hypothetical protein
MNYVRTRHQLACVFRVPIGSSLLGPAWNQLTAHAAHAGALAVVANPHGTMVAPLAQGTHMMVIHLMVVWALQAPDE